MMAWMIAVAAMVPALAIPALMACRGALAGRLVAVQLASGIAGLILAAMTFAFDQSAFIDLALTLSFLALPGTLLMALFIERWL